MKGIHLSKKTLNLVKMGLAVLIIPHVLILAYLCLGLLILNARQPTEYLIPNDYVGWIRIEYEVKNYPALPQRDGYIVAKIPPTGVLRTSSKQEKGAAVDQYYYLTQAGERQNIKIVSVDGIGIVHPYRGANKSEDKFIGTKMQLEKFGWSHTGRPGPIKIPQ